jgi:hypothetical protein
MINANSKINQGKTNSVFHSQFNYIVLQLKLNLIN